MNNITKKDVNSFPVNPTEETRELEAENKLLFEQLAVIQEELERLHATPPKATVRVDLADDDYVQVYADNLRNAAFMAAYKRNRSVEQQYAIGMKQAYSLVAAVASFPRKLFGGDALGGKNFDKVIATYGKGGVRAVDALFDAQKVPDSLRAKALTALARSVQKDDVVATADLARKAYDLEPKPFRLKWLALRQHEAGVMEHAQANLDCLPEETKFSESESRQVEKLRAQSKAFWLGKALQLTNYQERHAVMKTQAVAASEKNHALQLSLAEKTEMGIVLQERLASLEGSKISLQAERKELQQNITSLSKENGALGEAKAILEKECAEVQREKNELRMALSEKTSAHVVLQASLVKLEAEKTLLCEAKKLLEQQISTLLAHKEEAKALSMSLQQVQNASASQGNLLGESFKRQSEELIKVRRYLDNIIKNESLNTTKQVQAFWGLQNYFATGELPAVNSEHHSWAIDMDFAHYLVEMVEGNQYDLVIEFGSGISTVVVAKTLVVKQGKTGQADVAKLVSFDHLEQYFRKTTAHLQQLNLQDYANVVLAGLEDWQAADGNTYSFYGCNETLSGIANELKAARILVIVDGPPAATGVHARYPAVPLVLSHFHGASIDVLLDDYIRADEKEVAQMWIADIEAAGLASNLIEKKLHKDACLIEIRPS